MPIIGAHVSAAGGLHQAIENANKIGADCIQIFGASPRTYEVKIPAAEEVKKYKEALKQSKIGPVFLHAAYLVNLASPNSYVRGQSVKNLAGHLKIAEMIGAQGLIFHIGSGKDSSRAEAIDKTVVGIKEVLRKVSGKTQLIMENTAGGGNSIGDTAEEIGAVLKKVKSARVKVCVDTAHAFEAGMISEYTPVNVKKFLNELDKQIGFVNIVAFHVNDSKTLASSHHDRHENIGQGHIGLAGFKNLARDKRMKNMPWILEVPGFKDEGPDARNIKILKNCCK
ncbi:MAG: deoxyribonuclease IV [Patescibacteria group bacterium]